MNATTAQNKKLGYLAEAKAQKHYENLGYKLLGKNFCVRGSELDLVFQKENLFIVVEVKLRKRNSQVEISDLLPHKKQEALKQGALAFLEKNILEYETIRFDLCLVRYAFLNVTKKLQGVTLECFEDIF